MEFRLRSKREGIQPLIELDQQMKVQHDAGIIADHFTRRNPSIDPYAMQTIIASLIKHGTLDRNKVKDFAVECIGQNYTATMEY